MAQDVKKHGETHNCKSERDDKNECAGTSIVCVCMAGMWYGDDHKNPRNE